MAYERDGIAGITVYKGALRHKLFLGVDWRLYWIIAPMAIFAYLFFIVFSRPILGILCAALSGMTFLIGQLSGDKSPYMIDEILTYAAWLKVFPNTSAPANTYPNKITPNHTNTFRNRED